MKESNKLYYLYGLSALFIIFMILCIILNMPFIPLAASMALLLMAVYFFAFDKVLWLVALLTPLAVPFDHEAFGFRVSFPVEPMLLLLVLLLFFKLLYDRKFDKEVVFHPVSIIVIISLIWFFITALTSEMPIVSLKHFLARVFFVIPCYFFGVHIFKNQKNINKYNWAYIGSLTIVVIYTLVKHSARGFTRSASVEIMKPFFPEHTCYGAMVVFVLPFLIFYILNRDYKRLYRLIALGVFIIIFLGALLSYTRAAWLGGIFAIGIFVCYLLKIRMRYIISMGVVLLGLFLVFQEPILVALERNRMVSSQNITEHVKSMTNISSDESNLERINRWKSALRMTKERPLVGWGPGTYQFVYAPFQRSGEKTGISTNAGDVGNAHSEYFGPLSEQGIPGLIIVLVMFSLIIATANKVFWKSKNKYDKYMSLVCMMALITYMIHGFLNNFLDIDKAAVLFWFYVAIIVSLDLKYKNELKQLSENKNYDS